jgi:hypothetical protein
VVILLYACILVGFLGAPFMRTVIILTLAASTAAQAEIVHRSVNLPSGAAHLDVDGNGQGDLGFIYLWDYSTDIHVEWIFAGGRPQDGFTAPLVPAGSLIGAASSFAQSSFLVKDLHRHVNGADEGPLEWSMWAPGSPTTEDPVFIGFRFGDPAATHHFGWIRYRIAISPTNPNSFDGAQILDFAYETEPGVPIIAGAVPSPMSALPLAAFFLARRRRRG